MLSLIVPAYEERENLEPLFSRLALAGTQLGERWELVLVDGHSPDKTAEEARRLLAAMGERMPGQVIELPQRCDLSQGIRAGINQAAGDLIGVMDADLSHPPELLPALVAAVRRGHPVAVASRYAPGGRVGHWPWSRRWLSHAGNLLTRPLTDVSDATSGYFVCESALARVLDGEVRGFKVLLELLARGGVRGAVEVPYAFADRLHGRSKLSGRVLRAYAAQLIRLYGYRLRHLGGAGADRVADDGLRGAGEPACRR